MRAGDIDSAVEDPGRYGTLTSASGSRTIETRAGRWRSYYENIAEAAQGRSEPVVKPAEMRRVMRVLDAAIRSGETGQVVRA